MRRFPILCAAFCLLSGCAGQIADAKSGLDQFGESYRQTFAAIADSAKRLLCQDQPVGNVQALYRTTEEMAAFNAWCSAAATPIPVKP